MKILVTGGSGFLGKKLLKVLGVKHEVVGTCFSKKSHHLRQLDLRYGSAIEALVVDENPNVVVHTASMTNVTECETQKLDAFLINTAGTFYLALACKSIGARMVYVSTDYVFSGWNSPYLEEDEPHPINFYGVTKLEAEHLVRAVIDNHIIVRTSILYGYNDRDDKPTFVTQICRELKKSVPVVVDNHRIRYPTLIDDVALGIEELIEGSAHGTFHLSNQEPLTRYQWARLIGEMFELPTELIGGADTEKKLVPPRPVNVQLRSCKPVRVRFRSVSEGLLSLRNQMGEFADENN